MKLYLPLSITVLLYISSGAAQKVRGLKGEVELITEPRPGDEFVQIHTTNGEQTPTKFLKPSSSRFGGSPSSYSKSRGLPGSERDVPIIPAKDKRLLRFSANHDSDVESDESADEMNVSIVDEGKTGFELKNADEDEKEILEHKIEPISDKQDSEEDLFEEEHEQQEKHNIDNVSLYMESKSGVQKSDAIEENDESPVKQLSTSKPLLEKPRDKHADKKSSSDKKYDILTFNKQKGSKQKYEENFDFVDSPFEDKLVSSGTSQTSRINVKKGPNGQDYEYEYVYYYYYDDPSDDPAGQKAQPAADAPKRQNSRVTTTPAPIQTSWRQQTTVTTTPEPAPIPARAENPRTRGRPSENTRYTVSSSNLDLDLPTEKISNELLPAVTTPSRFRGRNTQQTTEQVTEPLPEVPTSTRFPARSRGSTTTQAVQQQQFVSSTTPVAFDAPPTRTRGNIRRPSLELVDSSSFRTHSSDVSPDQDQNKPTTKFRGEPAPQHVIHSESFTTQPQQNFDQFQTRPVFTSQRNPIENTIPTEPLLDQVPITRGNTIDNVKPQEEFRGDRAAIMISFMVRAVSPDLVIFH
ncbi:hypothetical protein M8J77_026371 [Diaphorina citri]|nr:hypothetical protein M8J77_026371 [Diaphorina citri]